MRFLLRDLKAGRYYRLASRFASVRRAYSSLQAVRQQMGLQTPQAVVAAPSVSFVNLDIDGYARTLKIDGIVQGLSLPQSLVDEINRHAQVAPCRRAGVDRAFLKAEVSGGSLSTGETVLDAFVGDLARCEAIDMVRHDPGLFRIAGQYLGFTPRLVKASLKWSFHSDIPRHVQWERAEALQDGSPSSTVKTYGIEGSLRRVKQIFSGKTSYAPVYYHFDVFGYNCILVYFYITDVDRDCGAHVMLKGSHTKKTFRMLMHPGVYPESRLMQFYGRESEVLVEGQAGYGFIEDPSCYHALLPPTRADRLALTLTYL